MSKGTRWMLLGIFLGVAAVWCVARGSAHFIVAGEFLSIPAVLCFLYGFFGKP